MIVEDYLAMAEICGRLLRAPEVAGRWEQPSALPEFRISGLAGHIVVAGVLKVAEYLDKDVPAGEQQTDAVGYYVRATRPDVPADDPMSQGIRQLGEQEAEAGPQGLADTFDRQLADLQPRLLAVPPGESVLARVAVLPLDQWLLTRMIEFAVHADDLAVSVGIETPEFPAEAMDKILATLTKLATTHHGQVNVMRALTRKERTTQINAF